MIMTFGQKIGYCRTQFGWTQKELAEHLGISKRMVCYYEADSRFPRFDMLRKIASIFKVSIDYLLVNEITDPGKDFIEESYRVELMRYKDSDAIKDVVHSIFAAGGEPIREDDPNWELILNSVAEVYMKSKAIAKSKFTPRKYRKGVYIY